MSKVEETNILLEILKSPVLSALIGAIVASLLSPYLKWGIEKKRLRHNERVKMIEDAKSVFRRMDDSQKYPPDDFFRINEVVRVLPYLSKDLYNSMIEFQKGEKDKEKKVSLSVIGITGLKELVNLEIKWKLI